MKSQQDAEEEAETEPYRKAAEWAEKQEEEENKKFLTGDDEQKISEADIEWMKKLIENERDSLGETFGEDITETFDG